MLLLTAFVQLMNKALKCATQRCCQQILSPKQKLSGFPIIYIMLSRHGRKFFSFFANAHAKIMEKIGAKKKATPTYTNSESKTNQLLQVNPESQQQQSQLLSKLLDRSSDVHLPFGNVPTISADYFRARYEQLAQRNQ